MKPQSKPRQVSALEGKRAAASARCRSNVKFEQVAAALHLQITHTKRLFTDDMYSQLTYGDMFLLARDPNTVAMVRDLLAPLLELVDTRNLRLSDIDGLARSATSAHLALAMLRPTIERLVPLMNLADTGEVET